MLAWGSPVLAPLPPASLDARGGSWAKTWSSSCGPSLWPTCPPQAGPSCLSLSALRPSPPSLSDPFWMGKSPDSSNTTSFKLFYSSLNPLLSLKTQAFGNPKPWTHFFFFFFPCHFLPKVQVMGHPCGLTTVGKQREKAGAFLKSQRGGLCSQAGRRQGTWGACCVCREGGRGFAPWLASLG